MNMQEPAVHAMLTQGPWQWCRGRAGDPAGGSPAAAREGAVTGAAEPATGADAGAGKAGRDVTRDARARRLPFKSAALLWHFMDKLGAYEEGLSRMVAAMVRGKDGDAVVVATRDVGSIWLAMCLGPVGGGGGGGGGRAANARPRPLQPGMLARASARRLAAKVEATHERNRGEALGGTAAVPVSKPWLAGEEAATAPAPAGQRRASRISVRGRRRASHAGH